MASTRQGSRQYRKLKVSNDQGFSLSAIGDVLEQFSKDVKNFNFDLARKDIQAELLGVPADTLTIAAVADYYFSDWTNDDEGAEKAIDRVLALEPLGSEAIGQRIGAPTEGLESYADWLTLGLPGIPGIIKKVMKKPMNKAIKEHLAKKKGKLSPNRKITPIDLAERRDLALVKKKQKEKVQAKLSDEDLYDRRTDHQDDQYMFDYTEEDVMQDNAYRSWQNEYHSDPNVMEGKKMAEFTVRRREQELRKVNPKAKSFEEMTDEEMFEQMGGLDDMDYASPVQEIIPKSSKKIIQFQPRG